MIRTTQELVQVTTKIADAAYGRCQWCRGKIRKTFCVPAQVVLETGNGSIDTTKGIDLRYEVICKTCASNLKSALDQVRLEASARK